MGTVLNERGYLEEADGYLEGPYLAGEIDYGEGFQVQMIIDETKQTGFQTQMIIDDTSDTGIEIDIRRSIFTGFQVQMLINDTKEVGFQTQMIIDDTSDTGFQTQMIIDDTKETGFQTQMVVDDTTDTGFQTQMIVDTTDLNGFQTQMVVNDTKETGFQTQMIVDDTTDTGFQVSREVNDFTVSTGWEIKETEQHYVICGGYLEGPYLSGPYLARTYCLVYGWQISRTINTTEETGFQVQMVVDDTSDTGFQTQMIVDDELLTGFQATMVFKIDTGFQVNINLYNADRIRILCDFDSRGTTGLNVTSTSTEPGDFSATNLNNDLEEFYWRSATGIITGVDLTFDTEIVQGVLVDTIAVRNTNLTSSATLVVQGSNDSLFSTVIFEETLIRQDSGNYYYIAPSLPSDLIRYWRFRINDSTNPDGFLKIGTILFGQARLFFVECTTDIIFKEPTHFSDRIPTDGFTNVNNDRVIRDAMQLEFKNLQFGRGNYSTLRDISLFARTNLKCLWIADPRDAYIDRFTVFSKMARLPRERHNVKGTDIDLIDLTVELDESL